MLTGAGPPRRGPALDIRKPSWSHASTSTATARRAGPADTPSNSFQPLGIDRDDLLRGPVAEPEPAIVPARRLAELDPGQQNFRHGALLHVFADTSHQGCSSRTAPARAAR